MKKLGGSKSKQSHSVGKKLAVRRRPRLLNKIEHERWLALNSDPEFSARLGAISSRTEPTAQQIALLSASLSQSPDDDPSKLADAAIKLWETVELKLRNRILQQHRLRILESEFQRPKSYPVNRDDFMRLMLPQMNGRTGELAHVAKAFLKSLIESHPGQSGEASPEQVSALYSNWKPIPNWDEFRSKGAQFRYWWASYHSKTISESRKAAGSKSAEIKAKKKT